MLFYALVGLIQLLILLNYVLSVGSTYIVSEDIKIRVGWLYLYAELKNVPRVEKGDNRVLQLQVPRRGESIVDMCECLRKLTKLDSVEKLDIRYLHATKKTCTTERIWGITVSDLADVFLRYIRTNTSAQIDERELRRMVDGCLGIDTILAVDWGGVLLFGMFLWLYNSVSSFLTSGISILGVPKIFALLLCAVLLFLVVMSVLLVLLYFTCLILSAVRRWKERNQVC